MLKLKNASVEITKDDFTLEVIFTDPVLGVNTRIALQRALDPRDGEPGLDGVYLEVGVQKYVSYGAVEKITLSPEECSILVNVSEKFGGNSELVAKYQLTPAKYEALREALKFIFSDCDWALTYSDKPQ